MHPILLALDLILILTPIVLFKIAQSKDTVSWSQVLFIPAYWIGGLAAGHLLYMGIESFFDGHQVLHFSGALALGIILVAIWNKIHR